MHSLPRKWTLPIFASTSFLGTIFGPVMGGFIAQPRQFGWRGCFWTAATWSASAFVPGIRETNADATLWYKAIRLRRNKGQSADVKKPGIVYKAELEERIVKQALKVGLKRPFILLAAEPIIQLFTLYLTSEYRHHRDPKVNEGDLKTVVYVVLFRSFSA